MLDGEKRFVLFEFLEIPKCCKCRKNATRRIFTTGEGAKTYCGYHFNQIVEESGLESRVIRGDPHQKTGVKGVQTVSGMASSSIRHGDTDKVNAALDAEESKWMERNRARKKRTRTVVKERSEEAAWLNMIFKLNASGKEKTVILGGKYEYSLKKIEGNYYLFHNGEVKMECNSTGKKVIRYI